jgi:hypothetical protein
MNMKSRNSLRVVSLLALLLSLLPSGIAIALAPAALPPPDMFQLPWEQGASWVAYDGFDNGTKRLLNSPHNYHNGGALDFAPHANMRLGEDTSNAWVTAAAAGTVVEKSFCHLKINHGNGWITEYQFLANIQVQLGDAVSRNQRLAVIADGVNQPFCPPAREPDVPHVHFTLRPTMMDATFAGWTVNYNRLFNKTTFTKGDQTIGSYQPILNSPDLQISLRDAITWDTVYIGSVDAFRYERWPFVFDQAENFILTATPTTGGLNPLLLLLDANGNELARGAGTLSSTQPAGSYFVQVQPQAGSGFYNLLLQRNTAPVPSGPSVSTVVAPGSVNLGESALVTVNLQDVPADGYASAEFTCTYDGGLAEAANIVVTGLFGADPATAVNGPQNGSFIVAIAGSNGSRAAAGGPAFTFGLKGLQAGQTAIECKARVSKGDNTLTDLASTPGSLTILAGLPTPTLPPPVITATPTSPAGGWLTFTDVTYGFEFQYPPEGQIAAGGSDTFSHINLPFVPGTNLREKFLELLVAENANPCQSPLVTPLPPETVTINGLTFLKQTGEDGGVGHLHQWIAYSILRDNACVSLDFFLHSLNAGNFATPPVVFDYTAEAAVFEQIVSTFTWLGSPSTTPTPTSTPMPTLDGTLTGQVSAGKPVSINLFSADNALVTSASANPDGSFSLTAVPGTYTVVASASGFLNAQGSAVLTSGATTTKPAVSLVAGDIDANGVIDQFDAMTIGMSYNTALPAAADLNNDGVINVLDLELLAANYRKAGALLWE